MANPGSATHLIIMGRGVTTYCSFLDTFPTNTFLAETSVNSDATLSGKEMSDGYEGTHGGRGDGKVRKHHRKSSRTRSRQEKISRPKLNILNVGSKNNTGTLCSIDDSRIETAGTNCAVCGRRCAIPGIRWWSVSWKLIITKWSRSSSTWTATLRRRLRRTW